MDLHFRPASQSTSAHCSTTWFPKGNDATGRKTVSWYVLEPDCGAKLECVHGTGSPRIPYLVIWTPLEADSQTVNHRAHLDLFQWIMMGPSILPCPTRGRGAIATELHHDAIDIVIQIFGRFFLGVFTPTAAVAAFDLPESARMIAEVITLNRLIWWLQSTYTWYYIHHHTSPYFSVGKPFGAVGYRWFGTFLRYIHLLPTTDPGCSRCPAKSP